MENKITQKELNERINWTLNQKMMSLTNNGITYAEALKIALNMNIDDIYIPPFFQNFH